MSRPNPANVEAVARAAIEVAFYDIAVEFSLTMLPTGNNRAAVPPHWEGDALVKAEHYAEAILTSPDPAVHEALLAALDGTGALDAFTREQRADEIETLLVRHVDLGPRGPATGYLESRVEELRHG